MNTRGLINYLTQKGFIPKIYENIDAVENEFNTTNLKIKVIREAYSKRTVDSDTGKTISYDGYEPRKYYYQYSPILTILSRLIIVLTLLNLIYLVLVKGFATQSIVFTIFVCVLLYFADNYLKISMILLFIVGGMPFFAILYLIVTANFEGFKDFMSKSYYGLGFLFNTILFVSSILIYRSA